MDTESKSVRCLNCGAEMSCFETREEMIDAIRDTEFTLNKTFSGINSFSATEYVWSDLEMLRKRGHRVFSINQQLKNSPLTKMEIGIQFLELAKDNILKRAS